MTLHWWCVLQNLANGKRYSALVLLLARPRVGRKDTQQQVIMISRRFVIVSVRNRAGFVFRVCVRVCVCVNWLVNVFGHISAHSTKEWRS